MSKSLNDLLRGMTTKEKPPKKTETEIFNPDVPEFDDTREVHDQFRFNMKQTTMPRNGAGYSLPRKQLMNPKKAEFLMDGAIDPNIIRAKSDPDRALPTRSSLALFSYMPQSVHPGVSQNNLIRTARASEMNWKNRFMPQQEQP